MEDIITTIIEELREGKEVFTTMRGYTFNEVHSFLSVEDSDNLDKLHAWSTKPQTVAKAAELNDQIGTIYNRALNELAESIAPEVQQKRKQDAALAQAEDDATWRDMQ